MGVVHLVYLAAPTRGGRPTYTGHLAEGLRQAGRAVQLWRVARRADERPRPFRHLSYRHATLAHLVELARHHPVHITAAAPSHADQVAALLGAGASITVHGPAELRGELPAALRAARRPVVVTRRAVAAHVHAAGVGTAFVRPPYTCMSRPAPARTRHAVSYARLDWDKNTDAIAAANARLPARLRVELFGAENRLFTHHRLTAAFPDWRANYRGPFTAADLWAGAALGYSARWAVDMTARPGDGGGALYSHLEAIDGGARPLLNRAWFGGGFGSRDDQLLRECSTLTEPADLAAVLAEPPPPLPLQTSAALLARHSAHRQAARLLAAHEGNPAL